MRELRSCKLRCVAKKKKKHATDVENKLMGTRGEMGGEG